MNSTLDEGYTVLHWNSVNARENVLQNTYTEGSAIFDIHVKKNVPVEVTSMSNCQLMSCISVNFQYF